MRKSIQQLSSLKAALQQASHGSRLLHRSAVLGGATQLRWFSELKGGAGYGNVKDRVFPSYRKETKPMYRFTSDPHTCSIIGAPMTYGQPFAGTDVGPKLLRDAGLLKQLGALGWRVEDAGDIDFENAPKLPSEDEEEAVSLATWKGNGKNSLLVGRGTYQLADMVESKLRSGKFPLVLGGDHSIGIGTLAGVLRAQPNTGVLWIDAHADLNTPFNSESGNMHGMPVGLLMEGVAPTYQGEGSVPGLNWLSKIPKLDPSSIVYVGLRDVDPSEREAIQSLGIAAFTMHDIDHYGIGKTMDMALEHLLHADPNRPLHLSYDIDAVDPGLAPATGTKVRGGLTFREANYIPEIVSLSGNLMSADIVEVNPSLSHLEGTQETVDLGMMIITSLMGKSII